MRLLGWIHCNFICLFVLANMGASQRLRNITELFPDTTLSTTLNKSFEVKHSLVFPLGTSSWNKVTSLRWSFCQYLQHSDISKSTFRESEFDTSKSTIFSCNLGVSWEWRLNLKKQDEVEYLGTRRISSNYRTVFSWINQDLSDGHFYPFSKIIQRFIQVWVIQG